MLFSVTFAQAAIYSSAVQSENRYKGVVTIEGNGALARFVADMFSRMGYKVYIINTDTKTKQVWNDNNKHKLGTRQTDTAPPSVEITSPANKSYVSGNVTLTILASDNESVDTVILYIDGSEVKRWSGAGTYKYYWYTPNYGDGTHNVTVWANDTSGNTNSTYYEYIVDNTEPTVTISTPTDGEYIGSSDVTVSWTGNDNLGVDHYEVSLDGGSWIDVGTDTSYTFTGLSDGDHNVTVMVVDKAGNANFDVVIFTVDTSDPTVTITSPSSGSWTNIKNVTITWSANDSGSGIDHYEVRCYNSTWDSGWINVGLNTSYTFTNLGDDQYTVQVVAYDKAGNTGSDQITVGVDTTPPTVSITSPSDGAYINDSYVTVQWTGGDTLSGIDHYEVRMKNNTWDSGWIDKGTSTSHTFTNLGEGQYTIYVKAVDTAGNIAADSVSISIDLTAPSVTIISPSSGSYVRGIVTVNVSWDDANPDKCEPVSYTHLTLPTN